MVEEVFVACADTASLNWRIYCSSDKGTKWTATSGLTGAWLAGSLKGRNLVNLELDNRNHPKALYVGTATGLYKMDIDNYSGTLASDATLGLSPVYMNGDVTIPDGVTLTVGPGVEVEIAVGDRAASGSDSTLSELIVQGKLEVSGSSGSTAAFDPDVEWYGIVVEDSGQIVLNYADIYDAYIGVYSRGSNNDTITNCYITSSDLCGIKTQNGNLVVTDTKIDQIDTGYGIYVDSCHPTIADDSLVSCEHGIYLYKSKVSIRDCVIRGPGATGIYMYHRADTGLTNAATLVNVEVSNTHTQHIYSAIGNLDIDSCSLVSPNFAAERSDYGIATSFTSYLKLRNTLIKDYDAAGLITGYSTTSHWDELMSRVV